MDNTTWNYSDNTPVIDGLTHKMEEHSVIDTDLYSKYNVKRGLRDIDGKGVLTGLTDISTIKQNKLVDGKLVPCDGELPDRQRSGAVPAEGRSGAVLAGARAALL